MSTNEFRDWYQSVPRITRGWLTGSVVLPLLGRFGMISPYLCVLSFELFVYKFHFWRPLTALFYFPIGPQTGFQYIINLYFLYSYSSRLESTTYDGKPADYLFMLIFNWLCLVIIGFVANMSLIMNPMILSVMYIWCQLNRDQIVSFWFGAQFKAIYMPWVLMGFNMVINGGGLQEIIGIAVGHLYFFLAFKYPQDYNGIEILRTPDILYKYFPSSQNAVHGFFGRAPERRSAPRPNQNYGRGYRLGQD